MNTADITIKCGHPRCINTILVMLAWFAGSVPAFSTAHAQLILNEALANEPGRFTSGEWVELLCRPDTGDAGCSLAGYRFVDGNDTTELDGAVTLIPGGFAVLASRVTGDNSFEAVWGDNSGVWGDAGSESYPVLAAKMSLRNSTDTVSLIAPNGSLSTMFWSGSAADGQSLERIRPDHGDDPGNFALSRDSSGATPGRVNSVFPAGNDLVIDRLWTSGPPPAWGQPITILAQITNVGYGSVTDVTVRLSRVIDFTLPDGEREILTGWWIQSLPEGAADTLGFTWSGATPGNHILIAGIDDDGNAQNNIEQRLILAVRYTKPLAVVSEYLANPEPGGPGEWIEIANQAEFTLDLRGVRIGDSRGDAVIPGYAGTIPPGGFRVLAEDLASFESFYAPFNGMVFEIPAWRELNNDGDMIRLLGAAGEIIDSLSYLAVYDGNRSVERTELSATFAAPDVWTASVDSSGATPGRANSVDRSLAGRLAMRAQPNPFFLSSGGTMQIEVRVAIGAALTVKVLDRAGNTVRLLRDQEPAASGVIIWDGTNDHGETVRPGAYVLWARSQPSGRETRMMVAVGP